MLNFRLAKLTACFYLILLLSGGFVSAQPKFIISNFQFSSVAPPASLSWQLATPGGEHVDVAITGIQPAAGTQLAYIITPENAAEFGVDFSAWSLAVNDPNFSRSIMTWTGVTQEKPVVRNFPQIELDDIRIFVNSYFWPDTGGGLPLVDIRAFASDNPIIPEPGTWLLAILSITWLSIHRNSRSRRCSCRCR
jgi:hypothetical protein